MIGFLECRDYIRRGKHFGLCCESLLGWADMYSMRKSGTGLLRDKSVLDATESDIDRLKVPIGVTEFEMRVLVVGNITGEGTTNHLRGFLFWQSTIIKDALNSGDIPTVLEALFPHCLNRVLEAEQWGLLSAVDYYKDGTINKEAFKSLLKVRL